MAAVVEVKYFNSFILRKVVDASGDNVIWNGINGSAKPLPIDPNANQQRSWFVEEARIRGGYNNTNVDYGVRAYLVENEPQAIHKQNSLIYSGVFNSRTGINDTNVFSVGEDITKSVDPANGSIQKLYAEDTNLIIFQENKVNRALIDKDAIYSAEGNATLTTAPVVIGQIQAFSGNFGISKNPESFAVYGYRKYFTDKERNAVLRLSMDGISEISNYGMYDFFRDNLSGLNSTTSSGKAIGMWDIYNKQYVISLQPDLAQTPTPTPEFNTLSFNEEVKGWESFYTYKPTLGTSLKNNFYTFKDAALYQHYSPDVSHGSFYGTTSPASIEFIFNPQVSVSKIFKTVNYEGDNGWQVDTFKSDLEKVGNPLKPSAINQDITAQVYSYNQGAYDDYGNQYPAQLIPPINHAGFVRMENKYKANLVNNSVASAGEIIFGNAITGIKGYFATVKISTDSVTDVGGAKELFAVSSEYTESSY